MNEARLGDEIDDFCIKCKRLTNHAIVSLLNGNAAKVRCRSCYHDHDFRNSVPLPSKKDLKKQQLFDQVLAGAGLPVVVEDIPPEIEEVVLPVAPVPVKKAGKAAKAKA